MADVTVNGVKLNYRQTGAGTDLVLVHGLGANQAFWNLALVAALARDFRVTTLDLRGHGYSSMPPTDYKPVDLARDLLALLDHTGVARAHLVGHSLGGLVILQAALADPARALSLTIADTRIRSVQPKQAVTESPDWPALRARLANHGIVIAEDEPEIGLALFEALGSLDWDETRRQAAKQYAYIPFAAGGTRLARRFQQLMEQTTIRADCRAGFDIPVERLARLHHPVLALYGERSPTRKTGERLPEVLANCRTVVVPGGHHFHPVTHPAFFREAVLEFLHGLPRGAGTIPPPPAGGSPR